MLYWLSFCDPDLPRGSQFLGAAIVEASEFLCAVATAHMLGCNPGGECLGEEISEETRIPPEYIGRLLNKAEIAKFEARIAN